VILQYGSRGSAVADLQRRLDISADGDFGPITRAAVEAFQRTHGLVVDGQAGPITLGALHRVGSWHAPKPRHIHSPAHRAPAGRAEQALHVAERYLGVRYVYGGESPSGFDCSGLVQYAYRQVGVSLPRTTYEQYRVGEPIPRSELQPGDLLFFDNVGHVGIYVGGGRFIHAPHTGTVVQFGTLSGWYAAHFVGARRVVR
jgi:cell wall-associated NlpC family hydrolase